MIGLVLKGTRVGVISSDETSGTTLSTHIPGANNIVGFYILKINSGVTISNGNIGLEVNARAGSHVYLDVQGWIYGRGGYAGGGGIYTCGTGTAPDGVAGSDGFDAMSLNCDVTINNTGRIYGGGGGGGGAGSAAFAGGCSGGGGGGGGQGFYSLFGVGGYTGGICTNFAGNNGVAGSNASAGSGGLGGANFSGAQGGNGGAGGAWGTAGSTGGNGTGGAFNGSGGTGGNPGKAIDKNGNNITWVAGSGAPYTIGVVS